MRYRMHSVAPADSVFTSMLAATTKHHRVARIDPDNATFVTGPNHVDGADVMYVVRLTEPSTLTCTHRRCPAPSIVVNVTPVGFHDSQAIAYEAIPKPAREHAADLMWDIRERLIAERLVP